MYRGRVGRVDHVSEVWVQSGVRGSFINFGLY